MTSLTRRSVLARSLLGAAILPVLARAGKTQTKTTHQVVIRGMAFNPPTLSIAAGDTVVFVNRGLVPHTATANDNSWDTGRLAHGAQATATFPAAGTYAYHCAIHPMMTGTITVA